jgi:hypothetical protein
MRLHQFGRAHALGRRACLRAGQLLQHLHGQLQLPAVAGRAPGHAGQQARQVGRDHRAEQHDHPGQVDPDQQDRQGGEGAVHHRIGRHRGSCTGSAALGDSMPSATKMPRRPRHGPSAPVCWARSGTARPCRPPAARTRSHRAAPARRRAGCPPRPARPRWHVRGERQAHPQDQRPERDGRPIDQHPLRERPRRRTRQMRFSVRSMVRISASAVITSTIARPTLPSLLALAANCVR